MPWRRKPLGRHRAFVVGRGDVVPDHPAACDGIRAPPTNADACLFIARAVRAARPYPQEALACPLLSTRL